jgi:hypothetical protein
MAGEALPGFGAGARPMAFNDHTDWGWDEQCCGPLGSVAASFRLLCAQLTEGLARFCGSAETVLLCPWPGAPRVGRRRRPDSCHILWIQFHEDLPATLGISRGPGA